MNSRSRTMPLFLLVAALILSPAEGRDRRPGTDPLVAGFLDPPATARPSTYWLWLNGYVNRDHLEKELRQFSELGIGGLCLFDMGARGDPRASPPAGPPFLSDPWLENLARALEIAGRYGLSVQLAACSSWDLGGSWVEPRHASMGLYWSEHRVEGPSKLDTVLPFPEVPKAAPRSSDGQLAFLREVAVLALAGDAGKDSSTGASRGASTGSVVKRSRIVNLTARLQPGGRLAWTVPAGPWTILRLVCANTGERLKVPSPNSDGLATDHFSREATRVFIESVTDRLRKRLGDPARTALKQIYLPSYEVRGATWTPDFLEQFRRYRGHDMTPYLPVLAGYTVESEEITRRFQEDYRKTLGDLLVDAYYRTASRAARRVGLGIEAEAGGPGPPVHQVPVDALKALGSIDEMRGEFWPWREHRPGLWVVKETACAAHVYGRRRVHMEAFTGFRHWEDGPFDLKPSADRAFCEGMNHVVWHTASHQPPGAGRPGWVYGAGTHLTPNLVWWPMARPFIDYLARCSFLLQQGLFVADVCFYYGDQGFNFVPPKHVPPSLGPGHDYDVVNAEVILHRMGVEDGRLTLPDGMRYEILVLPERQDMPLEVLRKIASLVRDGATVVGPRPVRSSGLEGYPARDGEVRRLADSLWGDCDGKTVLERRHGRGRIIQGRSLREVLRERGIGPDLEHGAGGDGADLDFIHRRTPEAEIYFVRNRRMRRESVKVHFRVTGRAPELWFPDTGRIIHQPVFEPTSTGVRVPLEFSPAGSVFVVFRKPAGGPHLIAADAGIRVTAVTEEEIRITAEENGSYRLRTAAGETIEVEVDDVPPPLSVPGPWTVRFAPGRGAPDSVYLETPKSWTESDDPGVRHFSGIARYEGRVELPPAWLRRGRRIHLDLGRLWAAGAVRVNGEELGVLWKPPYRVDITAAARAGPNSLEIDIANTWANRLVGDALAPEGHRIGRTNITRSGTPGKPWKEIPLRASGLLGPVRVLCSAELLSRRKADR